MKRKVWVASVLPWLEKHISVCVFASVWAVLVSTKAHKLLTFPHMQYLT